MTAPRWEWRTFGEHFEGAEERFAALTPDREEESDELYLLSLQSDASVKVRGGLLDVKQLEQVDEHGLEQWKPALKAPFPVPEADVGMALEALCAPVPSLERPAYTVEQLLDELVDPSPQLQALRVRKNRRHYSLGGCLAELSDVETGSGSRRTIVVESEEPDRVLEELRELGLESRRNVNMPRGLKALLGLGSRRYAVIDVGTNSVKFHLGERLADGEWRTVADRSEITRLGERLEETGRLGKEPMERTVAAIAEMVEEARLGGVEAIAAVGTAGLRQASNRAEFLETVRERAGVEVEVISGEEEGRLSYLAVAATLNLGRGSLVVFETGGGSSQFTFGESDRVDERFSLDVGAVPYTERFRLDRAVDEATLAAALEAIAADLSALDGRPTPDVLVGIGGAVTNLAAVKLQLEPYDPDIVRGSVLEGTELDRQIELYRTRDAEDRRRIRGLQPRRAEVILAGACVVRTVLAKLRRDSLTVSDRGLRHGLLLERFGF